MTIEETIAHEIEVAAIQRNNDKLNKTLGKSSPYYNTDCIKCAEEHEQLSKWLEELKEARNCMEENRKAGYNHGFTDGFNKAIDDFVEKLKQDVMTITFGLRICDIDRIAEQLKEQK